MTEISPSPDLRVPDQTESRSTDDERGSPRLALSGVVRHYGPVKAVDGVDLAVRPGELVALLGPSGCGKTTTLRLIAGFEPPAAGTIEISGRRVADKSRMVPPEHRKVGVVFQDYALFPHMTVVQNVAFGLPKGADRAVRVANALSLVGLDGLGDRMPSQLSGGQQQRVALARALAPRPQLILLDEPFSNLDPHLRNQVRDEVREILRRAGVTAVLVTHDQEEALSLADRVAVMFDGRIAQFDSPERVYHRPIDREVAGFIGEALFVSGEANGDRVETVLGTLPLVEHNRGPVDVLIRPEMVLVSDAIDERGALGRVQRRRFNGRDLLLTIELEQGQEVLARFDNMAPFHPGDDVSIQVRTAVMAFSR